MNVFIYAADIYCDGCGAEIRRDLDKAGKAPATPHIESTYDSDQYPKGPYGDGGGESDCPQHCGGCRAFLENPLTPDGVDYVRAAVADWVATHALGAETDSPVAQWRAFYADELGGVAEAA